MHITRVTFTGADTNTRIDDMIKISSMFPFVEWGILFSESRQGLESRYPVQEWIIELLDRVEHIPFVQLSAHLCGGWVRAILDEGVFSFLYRPSLRFNRIQLNLSTDAMRTALILKPALMSALPDKARRPIILGCNYANLSFRRQVFTRSNIYPLFDASGGRGKTVSEWPNQLMEFDDLNKPIYCGYSGGLAPNNIKESLEAISKVTQENSEIWIDMESGVRTNNEFDLEKCTSVINSVLEFNDSTRTGNR